ncbi:MAG: CpaF family protein [Microthrixaceae bacterium]
MRLGDRLKQAAESQPASVMESRAPMASRALDPLAHIKARAQRALFDRLGARANDPDLDEDELRKLAVSELKKVLADEAIPLSAEEQRRIVDEVSDDVLGYGPLQPFLADPTITEVMANGLDGIWVERAGKLELTDAAFVSEAHIRRVIDRIASSVGRRIDEAQPMVDARLPDGSRMNAIIPPLAVDGPTITIRKFARDIYSAQDLVDIGTATEACMEMLGACVTGKLNILISGGTGTGKTTLLNALSNFIPDDERIVTIEDAVELRLSQRHVVRLEAKTRNIEGKGEITIRELVRNSLRMRPDRIIVGEVRGGEALDMLQAMNTGHEGSLSTLHSNTPRDALARLETMVLMAGIDLPLRAIREQIASALDIVVHLSRLRDGSRRIVQITEVEGMEQEHITMNTILEFEHGAGEDEHGRALGTLQATGVRPRFSDRLHEEGIELSPDLFAARPKRISRA